MDQLTELAGMIAGARGAVLVLTGAGVSTESGLPDFRGEDGRWTIADWERLASAEAAVERPAELWAFKRGIMEESARAEPNQTHRVLAEMQRRGMVGVIATQNVDELHQRAGAADVVELHGTLRTSRCAGCEYTCRTAEALAQLDAGAAYPACPCCGEPLRPDIVLFGEPLPYRESKRISRLAYSGDVRVMLCLGSSLRVRPVASYPHYARQSGAKLAIVNRGETGYDDPGLHDLRIDEPLGETMTGLARLLGI